MGEASKKGGEMVGIKIFKKDLLCIVLFCFLLITIFVPYCILHASPVVVSGGPENDYESWIIRLNDNRLMVIFDRNPDWASGDLYVTFSTDNGVSWDPVLPIIQDSGDQATLSFLQLPGDTLRLWYASNESGTYHIYSAYSMDGVNWTKEGSLDLGWSPSVMHYDPTVILEPDSSLTMSYVVSGIGGHIANCPYGGIWDTLKTLVGQSGFRPRIMKHDNGTYLYAYHRKSGPGTYDYDVFIRTSTDRVTWSDSIRLTYNLNSHDPFPNQTPDGAYLVYYAKYVPPAYNLCRRRSYDAIVWETEEQITSDPTNNTQPHFFSESNEIYLVWAHCVSYPYNHDVYFERFPYTGIKEIYLETLPHSPISVNIHPNPTSYKVYIKLCIEQIVDTFHGTSRAKGIDLNIYDASGKLVKSFPLSTNNYPLTTAVVWDGTDDGGNIVSNGTYFLIVYHQKGKIFKKFIVVR